MLPTTVSSSAVVQHHDNTADQPPPFHLQQFWSSLLFCLLSLLLDLVLALTVLLMFTHPVSPLSEGAEQCPHAWMKTAEDIGQAAARGQVNFFTNNDTQDASHHKGRQNVFPCSNGTTHMHATAESEDSLLGLPALSWLPILRWKPSP